MQRDSNFLFESPRIYLYSFSTSLLFISVHGRQVEALIVFQFWRLKKVNADYEYVEIAVTFWYIETNLASGLSGYCHATDEIQQCSSLWINLNNMGKKIKFNPFEVRRSLI